MMMPPAPSGLPVTPPRISVAIPLHDEEHVLPELIGRLAAVLDGLQGGPHEIVLVDDGSVDRTFELIRDAAAGDGRVVGIRLSRNFGHQAALTAALETVSGDVTVIMDGDLQDRPEEIPRFLAEHARGYDVVYAQRTQRKEGLALRGSYFVFYRLLNRFADLEVPVDSGDFALVSRRVVEQLNRLPERHRYLRGLRTWVGFPQTGISVERDRRAGGTPSYTMGKLLSLAFDGIFAFSVTPLRAAWVIGAVASAAATAYALWAVFERLFLGTSPQGFTALIVAITFFAGIQLLFLGLIGEYLGRVYDEAKSRPHFVVAEVVQGQVDAEPSR